VRISDQEKTINKGIDKEIGDQSKKEAKDVKDAQKDFDKSFSSFKNGRASWDDVEKKQQGLGKEQKDMEKAAQVDQKDKKAGGFKASKEAGDLGKNCETQAGEAAKAGKSADKIAEAYTKGQGSKGDVDKAFGAFEKEKKEAAAAHEKFDKKLGGEVADYRKNIGLDDKA
jgi:predicted  nucleic acid-binding Zn-ribbon protein